MARSAEEQARAQVYSPYAGRKYPTRVWWGDTHLHTANSADAFLSGNRMGPEDAYRFARGEEMTSTTGVPMKLSRPLDFLVVADHAEGLGDSAAHLKGIPAFYQDPTLVRWRKMMMAGGDEGRKAALEVMKARRQARCRHRPRIRPSSDPSSLLQSSLRRVENTPEKSMREDRADPPYFKPPLTDDQILDQVLTTG